MEKNGMTWEEFCLSKEPLVKKMFPKADLKNPKTLTDKLQWLKIHDSTFLKAFCADKITLREYCKIKLGRDLCLPILAVYNRPEQIDWDSLPQQFVIKCNHGSGYNIIVKDKRTLNKSKVVAALNKWLRTEYGSLSYELFYNLIPRKIFIEQYEENFGKASLTDYKFVCFNGEVKYLQVINGRFTKDLHFNYYTTDFKPMLDVSWNAHPARYDLLDDKPSNYDEMLELAKKLCVDFKCVRVDFYSIEGRTYLSELTFIPASGNITYKDPTTDLKLGRLLKL
jgi:hypothetical protein